MRNLMVLVLGLMVAGCSSDSDDDGAAGTGDPPGSATCPDVSGTWELTDHCDGTMIGEIMAVTQTGCDYSSASGGFDCPGTLGTDGTVTQTCDVGGGQTISCTGQASTGSFVLDCTGDCHVEAARP